MSNNSVARTPGPWVNVGDSVNRVDDWEFIADCNGQNNDPNKDIANATFIVTACNAHDDLVAALSEAVRLLQRTDMDMERGERTNPTSIDVCLTRARAALAKVQS